MRSTSGKTKLFAIIVLLFLITNSTLLADYKVEFSTSAGHTGNLFSDSTRQIDSYIMNRATLKLYPISTIELKLDGEYSHYSEIMDLTSVYGNASVTYIPTPENWPVSIHLNGYYNSRGYGEALEDHNSSNYGVSLVMGYELSPSVHLRSGMIYKATNYPETEVDTADLESFEISRDYDNVKLLGGLNITLPFSNVLDIEIGQERMNLSYVEPPANRDYLNRNFDDIIDDYYMSFYISPRLSRPIGRKIGVNITYVKSRFSKEDNIVIPRISDKFLSPWLTFWDGEAVSLNIKSYLLSGYVINIGIGYWEKEYLKTEEKRLKIFNWDPAWIIKSRYDYQERRYFSIQKPILIYGGTYIEPNVRIDYTHNNSSNDIYDYSHISYAAGITIRF